MFGRIKKLDNSIIEGISKIHKPAITKIMITASMSCNLGIIWWLFCLPFLLRAEWRRTGFNIIFGIAIAHIMGELIIKHIVKRSRPCHRLDDDELLIARPRFYSFPSGHSMSSFAVVGVTLLRCQLITFLPILLIASLIAFSRLYLRVHYLTDVLAGVLLGFTCGVSSVLIFNAFIPM
ncbi:MAG: phosphatase PAP2 family protein [Ruminococcus sp.]|nr:phosphatase PAP2 family protein [Ruminococcus sp.]